MDTLKKYWKQFTILGIGIIVMSLVFIRQEHQGNCTNLVQTFLHEKFEGVVQKKTTLQKQHNARVIYLENRTAPIYVQAMIKTGFYEEVRSGDYLIKHEDELRCLIIRGSDTLVFLREEPDCEKFKE